MKDAWDKLKITSDVLKNNWPLVLMAITALSSLSTNAAQYFSGVEKEAEVLAAQQQVTEVANHLTQTKIIIKESGCTECIRRIEKLERWH